MFNLFSKGFLMGLLLSTTAFSSSLDKFNHEGIQKRVNQEEPSSPKRRMISEAEPKTSLDLSIKEPLAVKDETVMQKSQHFLLTINHIKDNLSKFNPGKSRQNSLDCCKSFVQWVVSRELDLKNSTSPEELELAPDDSFRRYLAHDTDKIPMTAEQFTSFRSETIQNLPFIDVKGGAYKTGILYLIFKSPHENQNPGSYMNYYVYKEGDKKSSYWMIDPQSCEVIAFGKLRKAFSKLYETTPLYFWNYEGVNSSLLIPLIIQEEVLGDPVTKSQPEVSQTKTFPETSMPKNAPAPIVKSLPPAESSPLRKLNNLAKIASLPNESVAPAFARIPSIMPQNGLNGMEDFKTVCERLIFNSGSISNEKAFIELLQLKKNKHMSKLQSSQSLYALALMRAHNLTDKLSDQKAITYVAKFIAVNSANKPELQKGMAILDVLTKRMQ